MVDGKINLEAWDPETRELLSVKNTITAIRCDLAAPPSRCDRRDTRTLLHGGERKEQQKQDQTRIACRLRRDEKEDVEHRRHTNQGMNGVNQEHR